jgi:DNA repair protein RadC
VQLTSSLAQKVCLGIGEALVPPGNGSKTISLNQGTLNASLVHPREVYKGALLANANAIMVVHNHPSGNPEPSRADKEVTTKLIQAGNILDINLLDHFIIGNNQHYSFFANGLIPK